MEGDRAEGYVGLTQDEIRLIWAVNYFGDRIRNLEQCRDFVDGKMRELEERFPGLRSALRGAQEIVGGKV